MTKEIVNKQPTKQEILKSVFWLIETLARIAAGGVVWVQFVNTGNILLAIVGFYFVFTAAFIMVQHFINAHKV